jgi:propanol-preferring alcohol dehydrogenase
VAGIYLTDIPAIVYESELFYEKNLRSVTANTRADGEEFLHLAAAASIRVVVTPYPLGRADEALRDLAADRVEGAAVLVV